ncbi:sensor histidine kinase [Paenibacillus flagellatus]|uniref:histidine kinase n=1 Tax=Paenibacillus flagellatus TaxID=2211139 RepID=A0A2V5K1Q3_9BACL|nr:histidine kinase [Paenibacillus flagellatus]PYI53109.1 two-component sensor histidine kinase [Paenibacillus flagellatus]
MSFQRLKWFTILLPAIVIGGFELIRHELLLHYLSMEVGNFFIIGLTLLLSYWFSNWMFRKIHRMNRTLAEEQARRAVYEERERLARELHDNIAQMLFFVNVRLKQGKTEEARSAVSEIDHHLRQAIFNLRSLPEDSVAFPDRLNRWLREWSVISGVEVEQRIDWPETEPLFTPSEEVQLFAIVQEAFTNIRKHSEADRASIAWTCDPGGRWTLVVKDNGKGLRSGADDERKYGLPMMRKRAADMNAVLTVRSPGDGGTELTVEGRKERGAG